MTRTGAPVRLGTVTPPRGIVAVDPDPHVIARAASMLRAGHLVAFPTETVYGLGAHARDPRAIRAVFAGKGRPATDPLIVHVADIAGARSVCGDWPDSAELLAEAFWPGPLTLVLPRSDDVPDEITAGGPTVGVRIPAHPVALALLRAAQVPIAAPSANRFGRISPTTAEHVAEELTGIFDLLIDGGPTPFGVESTVVDLTGERPVVLRPGVVTLEDLTAVVGPVEHHERRADPEEAAADSPGTFLRHYAPSTPLVVFEGSDDVLDELVAAMREESVAVRIVASDPDPELAARHLYAELRRADASGARLLVVRLVRPDGIGRAVNDRLFRAAHGRVVLDASPETVGRLLDLASSTR